LNLAELLYVVFAVLALVSKLGGGIDQTVFAQLPPYSPPIENQNQNTNNLPLNNNPVQPTTPSMGSNCMDISSSEGGYVSCGTNQNQNQNQHADNLPFNNNNNAIQPSNGLPLNNNAIQSSNVNKNPIQTSNVKPSMSSNHMVTSSGRDIMMSSSLQSNTPNTSINRGVTQYFVKSPCPDLNVTNDITFKLRHAEVVKFQNVIKAVSTPPTVSVNSQIPVHFGNGTDLNITITISPQAQEICGTNHDDYIVGSEGDDIIFGLRGNDIISALGGDDLVFGGPGDDFVYGNDGNNQLFGEAGNDNLVGGINDDVIVGGLGNDRLYGNTGDDILQGGPGADYFDCGDGIDTVVDYNPSEGDIVSISCENVNSGHSSGGDNANSVHSSENANSVHSSENANSGHSSGGDNANSGHSSRINGKQSVTSKPPPISALH
jgi:hemolysin type calcium-binding protein